MPCHRGRRRACRQTSAGQQLYLTQRIGHKLPSETQSRLEVSRIGRWAATA